MLKEWTRGDLLSVSSAYWRGCALQAGVRLGIFTAIGGGLCAAAEVAEAIGADERATGLLLDALAAMGLLQKEEGRYRNTATAEEFLIAGALRLYGPYHPASPSYPRRLGPARPGRAPGRAGAETLLRGRDRAGELSDGHVQPGDGCGPDPGRPAAARRPQAPPRSRRRAGHLCHPLLPGQSRPAGGDLRPADHRALRPGDGREIRADRADRFPARRFHLRPDRRRPLRCRLALPCPAQQQPRAVSGPDRQDGGGAGLPAARS